MNDFASFSRLVTRRFGIMSKDELFTVDIDGDTLWEVYLSAFPDGSNPIFRKRTEHDCSCCKHFVRNVGGVVSLVNDEMTTVWDVDAAYPYNEVCARLSDIIRQRPIAGVFRTKQHQFGAEHTHELRDGKSHRWDHFVARPALRHRTDDAATVRGQVYTDAKLLRRGLETLTIEALNDVLDLINGKTLYRGNQFAGALSDFYALKTKYDDPSYNAEILVWTHATKPVARFRNTVIGTLVQDLSEGMELERAVRRYEEKTAPANYKRPTALVTPKMVEQAMATIRELDLERAVERRFARLEDVSVNDVLFVDNEVRGRMRGGLEDVLMDAAVKPTPSTDIVTVVGVDEFVNKVVPKARHMSVLLKHPASSNFMSLTAPVHEDAGSLFKWDNNFAWSYDGNTTDSIKEKVKRAGGDVDATMRVSLEWYNRDDLDIHVLEPSGRHVYFGEMYDVLDVDMNAGYPITTEPVENLRWRGRVPDGTYDIWVEQFSKRDTENTGFALEVEFNGQTFHYSCAKSPPNKGKKTLFIQVRGGRLKDIAAAPGIEEGLPNVEKWGVMTNTFVRVSTLVASPNFWGENLAGHKHWFFILDGCKNPEPTRGIYNEFLSPELEHHRKVFELIGNKTKCPVVDDQLSGVGFTAARGDTATVSVTNSANSTRTYEVAF